MSGTMEIAGEQVQPTPIERASALPAGGPLVPATGTAPFTAVFHHEWEYVPEGPHIGKGGEWLPKICEARHMAGANGTRLVGKNGTNASNMLAGIANKRSVVIPLFDKRLGKFGGYLKKYPVIGKFGLKAFYCYDWVKAFLIHNGRDVTFKQDMERAYGFRRQVVVGGIVDPMPRQALESEAALIRNRMTRWDDLMSAGKMDRDAYNEKVADALKTIELMERAFDRQFGSYEGPAVALDGASVSDTELFAEDEPKVPTDDDTDDDVDGDDDVEIEPTPTRKGGR